MQSHPTAINFIPCGKSWLEKYLSCLQSLDSGLGGDRGVANWKLPTTPPSCCAMGSFMTRVLCVSSEC